MSEPSATQITYRCELSRALSAGILSFLTSHDLKGLMIAAIIFGVSDAGGDVAGSLWVTKFAPASRVADYMSAHTCFTGFRGLITPLVAFQLITGLSLQTMGWISASMILVATLLLLPEVKLGSSSRRMPALIEEISE